MTYRPSKRAVWLAVNSKDGDRLIEIMQEHLKLAACAGQIKDDTSREIIEAKINALRQERDRIIAKYEEEVEEDVTD